MVKKVLLQLLLLALPFIVYFVYAKLANRPGGPVWHRAPWYWLLTTGLALSIGGAVFLIFLGAGDPYAEYVPAQVEDGKVVPGRFK